MQKRRTWLLKMAVFLAAAAAGLSASGCTTLPKHSLAGRLSGKIIRSVHSSGSVFVHYFGHDGKVHTVVDDALPLAGHWAVRGSELCFQWVFTPTRDEDCWRFDQPIGSGVTTIARNRVGRSVTATML